MFCHSCGRLGTAIQQFFGIFLFITNDIIDICLDNVFKAVVTRDLPASNGALSKLISALICREVTVDAVRANEPPIDNLRDR
jgi:hypothetical protein